LIRNLWRLLTFWKPHWLAVLMAYATLFAATGFQLYLPDVIRRAIDDGITGGDERVLRNAGMVILASTPAASSATSTATWASTSLPARGYDLRNALYSAFRLSFSFHDKSQTGQ
jgi:ABC-type multidrug transport system fused ATPase/permease subunit